MMADKHLNLLSHYWQDSMSLESSSVQSFLRWFEKNLGFEVYIKVFSNGQGLICKKDDNDEILKFNDPLDLYHKMVSLSKKFPFPE